MKNLMVYIHPRGAFDRDSELMNEIQIDNSLDYWKPEDIILATNFPYEYHGIKSLVVDPKVYLPSDYEQIYNGIWRFVKFFVTIHLIENKIINELTWVHDFDSFQLIHLDLPPLDRDFFLLDYGYRSKIQLGNVFFKPSALDSFKWMTEIMIKYKIHEEDALNHHLIPQNYNNIHSRFRKLNITYNIGVRHVQLKINFAEKPVKIAHFHPAKKHQADQYKETNLLSPKLYKLLNDRFSLNWY